MAGTVRLVCLANSRKRSGRCVAGFDASTGSWIRPVSDAADGTVPTGDTILDSGDELRVLDRFDVDLGEPRADEVQPENFLYSGTPWKAGGRLEAAEATGLLEEMSEPGPELFGSVGASVTPIDLGASAHGSLAVVEPTGLTWELTTDFYRRRRLRARFELSSQPYDLVVTDPSFFRNFSGEPLGLYPRESGGINENDRIWFTISLTEPFEDTGECYKLVAAVIFIGD